MKIDGHPLRVHLITLVPLFCLIICVWIFRLIIGIAGLPHWLIYVASMNNVSVLATLLAVLVIHARQFGGYTSVVVTSLLLNTMAQALIIVAILFGVLTGTENIFNAPEFSPLPHDPYHLSHMYAHLTYGIGISTLVGAAVGCLLLWLLRVLAPTLPPPPTSNDED